VREQEVTKEGLDLTTTSVMAVASGRE